MTEHHKTQIKRLREEGFGYAKIAQMLSLSLNTVKSYCRRNDLMGAIGFVQRNAEQEHFCKMCGLPVQQDPRRKEKKFCSDVCRQTWWNSHQDQVQRKALYEQACPNCGKVFTAYSNSRRKYCCHACYIADRFGGERDAG